MTAAWRSMVSSWKLRLRSTKGLSPKQNDADGVQSRGISHHQGRWQSVEFVPIAARVNEDSVVVPGCVCLLEDVFYDYYDTSEFYETVFLYIAVKAIKAEEVGQTKNKSANYVENIQAVLKGIED